MFGVWFGLARPQSRSQRASLLLFCWCCLFRWSPFLWGCRILHQRICVCRSSWDGGWGGSPLLAAGGLAEAESSSTSGSRGRFVPAAGVRAKSNSFRGCREQFPDVPTGCGPSISIFRLLGVTTWVCGFVGASASTSSYIFTVTLLPEITSGSSSSSSSPFSSCGSAFTSEHSPVSDSSSAGESWSTSGSSSAAAFSASRAASACFSAFFFLAA